MAAPKADAYIEKLKAASKPGAVDYGAWRSIQSGPDGAGGAKAWGSKGKLDPMEEINGWLACMGRGSRSATLITPEAIEAQRSGEVSDARLHHTSIHFSHGPYMDDWSKVPPEVAAKYNTSPSYTGEFPANQGWSYKKA